MNVLFDLDGTLTDSREGIVASIGHALERLGQRVPPASVLQRMIGSPLRDVFRQFLSDADERVEEGIAAYRERFAAVGMFENSVYDGIPETLQAMLARDVRLFVATSKPRIFAEQILEHFGLRRYFTAVYGSELNGERSDKADLIAHLLAQSKLPAAETIMVGDRLHDIRGALQNRVTPIGVLWGYGDRDELIAAGATRLAERPRDLERLIV